MAERKLSRWVLRGGVLASAVLPLVVGLPLAAALLVLLPAAVEIAREYRERATFTAAAAVLALTGWVMLPQTAAIPALLWCAICAGMTWRPADEPVRRGGCWLCAAVVTLATALALLSRHYGGDLFEGLAWDAVQWLSSRENGVTLLLRAYQAGFASLEKEAAMLPALNFFGHVVMAENIRLELMYSLRTTLAEALELLAPRLAVDWLGLTALIGAALPESIRRRRGQMAQLPTFDQWRLPDGIGGGILAAGGQPAAAADGSACGAACGRDVHGGAEPRLPGAGPVHHGMDDEAAGNIPCGAAAVDGRVPGVRFNDTNAAWRGGSDDGSAPPAPFNG